MPVFGTLAVVTCVRAVAPLLPAVLHAAPRKPVSKPSLNTVCVPTVVPGLMMLMRLLMPVTPEGAVARSHMLPPVGATACPLQTPLVNATGEAGMEPRERASLNTIVGSSLEITGTGPLAAVQVVGSPCVLLLVPLSMRLVAVGVWRSVPAVEALVLSKLMSTMRFRTPS